MDKETSDIIKILIGGILSGIAWAGKALWDHLSKKKQKEIEEIREKIEDDSDVKIARIATTDEFNARLFDKIDKLYGQLELLQKQISATVERATIAELSLANAQIELEHYKIKADNYKKEIDRLKEELRIYRLAEMEKGGRP